MLIFYICRLPVQQQHLWWCFHHLCLWLNSIFSRGSPFPMVFFISPSSCLAFYSINVSYDHIILYEYICSLFHYNYFFAALYLTAVSVLAGFWGQFFVRRLVKCLGRASIIVFILSGVIFASAVTMGKANLPELLIYNGFCTIICVVHFYIEVS